MDLAEVMTEVGTLLSTIPGLRVYDYEPSTISGDTAFMWLPESISFDEAYNRSADRMTLPVVVCVPNPTDRTARDRLGKYCDGSGTHSVKAALEVGPYTSFDSLRVVSVEFDGVTIGSVDYAGALFTIDIFGSGA